MTLLTDLINVVFFTALVYSGSRIIYNTLFHPLRGIPGPFFHRTTSLPWLFSWISGDFHRSLLEIHEKYGEVIRTAPNELSFISDAAYQQIHNTDDIIRDPQRYAKFIDGEQDLINYDHESAHRRFRKAFHQALNGAPLLAQESVIRKNTSIFRALVDTYVNDNNGEVDMNELYSWLAFDIAGDFIWRESFGCLKNMKSHPWLAAIQITSLGTYMLLIGISPWLQKAIWPFIPRKLLDYPRNVVREKSKMNLASDIPDEESVFSFASKRDLLSSSEMEANLMVMVAASSETIHTALLAATGLLGLHKACAHRAREELRAAFVSEEDISHPVVTNLPYLNAVVTEALRLCPAQPTSGARKVTSDSIIIDGNHIPKGTIIRAPQYCAGRYSRYFRDPHDFHPERWLDHPLFESDKRDVFHPFLAGRQSCPGRQFAEMELMHILARMLWAFEWELEDESFDISNWRTNMLWEKLPLNLRLIPIGG